VTWTPPSSPTARRDDRWPGREPGRHAPLRDDAVPLAGVVLAAGASRRFGDEPKQLADLHGIPVLEHAILSMCAVPALERIVVVLGAHADRILREVDFLDSEPVVCDAWEEGQAASLRCGLDALGETRKVLVALGDQPLLTPQVIAMAVDHGANHRLAFGGVPAHPVVLGPKLIRRARELRGDEGLRGERWKLVEAGQFGRLNRDVDTPQDLEEIRREARAVL
jgi:molybdenum cofactor cytidylyltransferase